jgi:hypothetical protein
MRGSVNAALLALLAALIVAGCGSTLNPDAALSLRPLTSAEIRQTLLGHTLYRRGGEWWRAWEYAGLHRAANSRGGIITGRVWWSNGQEIAEGEWQVTEEALYCRTWKNHWGDGKRGCFRASRGGDTLVFDHVSGSSGDAARYTYRLLPGNLHGL